MGKVVEAWRHAGFDCCIRVGSYSLDGYVRLPDGHPDRRLAETADEVDQAMDTDPIPFPFAMGFRHVPVEVHGGLSDGPDGDGWVGFDTAHALDYWADEDWRGIYGRTTGSLRTSSVSACSGMGSECGGPSIGFALR